MGLIPKEKELLLLWLCSRILQNSTWQLIVVLQKGTTSIFYEKEQIAKFNQSFGAEFGISFQPGCWILRELLLDSHRGSPKGLGTIRPLWGLLVVGGRIKQPSSPQQRNMMLTSFFKKNKPQERRLKSCGRIKTNLGLSTDNLRTPPGIYKWM